MLLEISAVPARHDGAPFAVRAVIVNDSYQPVELSREAFVGPTLVGTTASGMPVPENVEPNYGTPVEPIVLAPFALYGRERFFEDLPAGDHEFTAEYRPADPGGHLSLTTTITVEEV
jgi:hypothetical protein